MSKNKYLKILKDNNIKAGLAQEFISKANYPMAIFWLNAHKLKLRVQKIRIDEIIASIRANEMQEPGQCDE